MLVSRLTRLACFAGLAAASIAVGQTTIVSEDFESGQAHGWETNGGEIQSGGNPGNQLRTFFMDWQWIYLRNSSEGAAVIGDLTRHGGALTFSVDIQVYTLNNWFNEPMDPANFPLVIQFADATEPWVSVYAVGQGMPSQTAGWVRYTFEVPDPASTTLPAGWGGTGDEDPVTFEPRLPAGRTYTSVLQNVGEMRLTTAVPGYFYVSSFWDVGFDNVLVTVGAGQSCYANCDGSTTAPTLNVQDFACFLNAFASGASYANCDNSTAAPVLNVQDFACFLNSFAAGCT